MGYQLAHYCQELKRLIYQQMDLDLVGVYMYVLMCLCVTARDCHVQGEKEEPATASGEYKELPEVKEDEPKRG